MEKNLIENFIYAIYDRVTEKQAALFEQPNQVSAIRAFSRIDVKHETELDELQLLELGYRETEKIVGYDGPLYICTLREAKEKLKAHIDLINKNHVRKEEVENAK